MSRYPESKILAVDDDMVQLHFLSMLGKKNWFEVARAQTVSGGQHILESDDVSAAVIDIHLADGRSGLELVKWIRSHPKFGSLPVCVLSSDTSLDARVEAGRAGADLYLHKGAAGEDIVAVIQEMVSRRYDAPSDVLLVSDVHEYERAAAVLTPPHFALHHCLDGPTVLEKMATVRPDALLLVPETSERAADLCRAVRTMPRWKELPIVLAVDEVQRSRQQPTANRVLADDYVSLPLDGLELRNVLSVRVTRCRQLRADAQYDPLTGLLSRVAFLRGVVLQLESAYKADKPFSVAMLDLDRFKSINDTYGHSFGDRVLKALGQSLLTQLRQDEARGRWGGEEFVIAFPDADAEQAQMALNRVAQDLKSRITTGDFEPGLSVTFSAGIALAGADGADMKQLLEVADQRLYDAKAAGRNRIVIG